MACILPEMVEPTTQSAENATIEEALEHVESSNQVCTPNDVKMQVATSGYSFQLTLKLSSNFEGLQSMPLCDEWHRLVLYTKSLLTFKWMAKAGRSISNH
jgi:hypothetical protein